MRATRPRNVVGHGRATPAGWRVWDAPVPLRPERAGVGLTALPWTATEAVAAAKAASNSALVGKGARDV
jgi:hypothetical protein